MSMWYLTHFPINVFVAAGAWWSVSCERRWVELTGNAWLFSPVWCNYWKWFCLCLTVHSRESPGEMGETADQHWAVCVCVRSVEPLKSDGKRIKLRLSLKPASSFLPNLGNITWELYDAFGFWVKTEILPNRRHDIFLYHKLQKLCLQNDIRRVISGDNINK